VFGLAEVAKDVHKLAPPLRVLLVVQVMTTSWVYPATPDTHVAKGFPSAPNMTSNITTSGARHVFLKKVLGFYVTLFYYDGLYI
jgi:hypothetical protein